MWLFVYIRFLHVWFRFGLLSFALFFFALFCFSFPSLLLFSLAEDLNQAADIK